jgi:hypothetical protein
MTCWSRGRTDLQHVSHVVCKHQCLKGLCSSDVTVCCSAEKVVCAVWESCACQVCLQQFDDDPALVEDLSQRWPGERRCDL